MKINLKMEMVLLMIPAIDDFRDYQGLTLMR